MLSHQLTWNLTFGSRSLQEDISLASASPQVPSVRGRKALPPTNMEVQMANQEEVGVCAQTHVGWWEEKYLPGAPATQAQRVQVLHI